MVIIFIHDQIRLYIYVYGVVWLRRRLLPTQTQRWMVEIGTMRRGCWCDIRVVVQVSHPIHTTIYYI